jgi:hypothetical protein
MDYREFDGVCHPAGIWPIRWSAALEWRRRYLARTLVTD